MAVATGTPEMEQLRGVVIGTYTDTHGNTLMCTRGLAAIGAPFSLIHPSDPDAIAWMEREGKTEADLPHLRQHNGAIAPEQAAGFYVVTGWDHKDEYHRSGEWATSKNIRNSREMKRDDVIAMVLFIIDNTPAIVQKVCASRMTKKGTNYYSMGHVVTLLNHIVHKVVSTGKLKVSLSVREVMKVTGCGKDVASSLRMSLMKMMSSSRCRNNRNSSLAGAIHSRGKGGKVSRRMLKSSETEKRTYKSTQSFQWDINLKKLVDNLLDENGEINNYCCNDLDFFVYKGMFATKNALWFSSGQAESKVGYNSTDRILCMMILAGKSTADMKMWCLASGMSKSTFYSRKKKCAALCEQWLQLDGKPDVDSNLYHDQQVGLAAMKKRNYRLCEEQNTYRGFVVSNGSRVWNPEYTEAEQRNLYYLSRTLRSQAVQKKWAEQKEERTDLRQKAEQDIFRMLGADASNNQLNFAHLLKSSRHFRYWVSVRRILFRHGIGWFSAKNIYDVASLLMEIIDSNDCQEKARLGRMLKSLMVKYCGDGKQKWITDKLFDEILAAPPAFLHNRGHGGNYTPDLDQLESAISGDCNVTNLTGTDVKRLAQSVEWEHHATDCETRRDMFVAEKVQNARALATV